MPHNTNYNRGPKRRIERIRADIYHQSTNSQTSTVLHTAEDSKTLVRIRGQISMMHDDATDESIWLALGIAPDGVTIVQAATASETVDQNPADQELLRFSGQSKLDGDKVVWEFDSKAMRKMKTGDQIQLKDRSGGADAWFLSGPIYMWFKE